MIWVTRLCVENSPIVGCEVTMDVAPFESVGFLSDLKLDQDSKIWKPSIGIKST